MTISKVNHSNQEYECGQGKATLNIYNGKLGFEYPLIQIGSNSFNIPSTILYNSQYKSTDFNGKKIGLGNGYKLNIHQYVFPYVSSYNIEGFTEGNYVYIDSSWNVHRFVMYKGNDYKATYYDADGTGLKLVSTSNEGFEIIDTSNNIIKFDLEGRLNRIISSINSEIIKEIIYDNKGNLISIYDTRKPDRTIDFIYNGNNVLESTISTFNDIGYTFEYSDNKLFKIIKYHANGSKYVMEFKYNYLNKMEYAISLQEMLALKFDYSNYNNEDVVSKVTYGAMKKNILTIDTPAENYTGDEVYLGEDQYVNNIGKKYNGYTLSMPNEYVKEEVNITYNSGFTEITGDNEITIRYYFNNDGKVISNLEYRDGNLFTLSKEKGWKLSSSGDSNYKINLENANLITSGGYYSLPNISNFLNIFNDDENGEDSKYKYMEDFTISFWLTGNQAVSDDYIIKLSATKEGETIESADVKLNKASPGVWQYLSIPLSIGENQKDITDIKIHFGDLRIPKVISICDVRITAGIKSSIVIFDDQNKISTNYISKVKYKKENDDIETEEFVPSKLYLTDNDLLETYKNLYYMKKNSLNVFDFVCNNGSKIISVSSVRVCTPDGKSVNLTINDDDSPNYYSNMLYRISKRKWDVTSYKVIFEKDANENYYYYLKTFKKETSKVNDQIDDEDYLTSILYQSFKGINLYQKADKGVITKNIYDSYGNVKEVKVYNEDDTITEEIIVSYSYDNEEDRLRENVISQTENGITTSFTYNQDNTLNSITKGNNIVTYTYDPYKEYVTIFNNKDKYNQSSSKNAEVKYFNSGNIKYMNDNNNPIYGFKYNCFNELQRVYKDKKLILSNKSQKTQDTTLETVDTYFGDKKSSIQSTYDKLGRITKIEDEETITSFSYENDETKSSLLNRIIGINDGYSGDEYEFTYDEIDNFQEKVTINDKLTKTVYSNNYLEYEFNNSDKIIISASEEDDKKKYKCIYTEKELNEDKVIGSFEYAYGYDSLGRINTKNNVYEIIEVHEERENDIDVNINKTITYKSGTTLPKKISYETEVNNSDVESFYYENTSYDDKGNITGVHENEIREDDIILRNYTYTYDSFNRLTKETNPEFGTLDYTYDTITGMPKEVKKNNNIIKTFTYDNGLLTEVNDNGKINTITYDNYGNMITYVDKKFTYNSRNQLHVYEILQPDLPLIERKEYRYIYEYNYQGVRYKKRIIEVNGGRLTSLIDVNYYLDGNKIIGEDWVDANGNITTKFRYFYDMEGISEIRYDGYNFTLIKDSLGNVSKVLHNGKIIGEYLYDAWGNNIINKISDLNEEEEFVLNNNPFRYKGYYYDVETGLFWLSSRYYSPELCRFISPDDVEYLDPESVNGLNLYCYCMNNPIMNVDPSGHFVINTLALIIIGAAVLTTAGAITYGAVTDTPVVLDFSVSAGMGADVGGKAGMSIVLDFKNDSFGFYPHYGYYYSAKYNTFGFSYSVGLISNYENEGDYAGPFVDFGGGFYGGIDHCYDPRYPYDNTVRASSISFGNNRGAYYGYDYYDYLGSISFDKVVEFLKRGVIIL